MTSMLDGRPLGKLRHVSLFGGPFNGTDLMTAQSELVKMPTVEVESRPFVDPCKLADALANGDYARYLPSGLHDDDGREVYTFDPDSPCVGRSS